MTRRGFVCEQILRTTPHNSLLHKGRRGRPFLFHAYLINKPSPPSSKNMVDYDLMLKRLRANAEQDPSKQAVGECDNCICGRSIIHQKENHHHHSPSIRETMIRLQASCLELIHSFIHWLPNGQDSSSQEKMVACWKRR